MSFHLSQRSKDRREGVDPQIIAVSDRAIQITVVDFGIPRHGGIRTTETQQALFKDGVSKCDGIHRKSKHQIRPGDEFGRAIDFYAYVNGQPTWDYLKMAMVGAAHLQAASELNIKVQWGGLWKNFKDYPHIQLLS